MIDPLAPLRRARDWLGTAEGRVHRRTTVTGSRAHIEVRGVHDDGRGGIADDLRTALERLEGVDWAAVDSIVGRAVVAFDPGSVELDDLLEVVQDVEDAHDVADQRFPHDRPDHPADREPLQRHTLAAAADVAGLGIAAVSQALHLVPIPGEIPGAIALLDHQPRIRRQLENRLGRPVTDVLLAGSQAAAQAFGQGPLGLGVDLGLRGSQIAEQLARRSTWERREPELVSGPESVRHRPIDVPPRPAPLPKGPVERYADGAGLAALGLVGATLGTTRDPRRAADIALTGVPKAATLGREMFASWLGVALSGRGVLVMDAGALRRLDRVTTLVLDARLIGSGHWSVDVVHVVGDAVDEATCAARTRQLLDPTDPRSPSRRGSWRLRPWQRGQGAPRGSDAAARRLVAGGRTALGLWRGDRVVAVIGVSEDPLPAAAGLVEEALDTGLEVVIAGGTDSAVERLGATDRWSAARISDRIRDHQGDGHVVLYVSGRAHKGLVVADVSIGVESPGHKAPLGADLVITTGMGQGWLVLHAIRRAKAVSRRSALLAAAGAGTGAAWSVMGPGRAAARRTMLAVNASAVATMAHGAVEGIGIGAIPVPLPPPERSWHELAGPEVVRLVGSDTRGLSADERSRRTRAETARVVRTPLSMPRAALAELANPLTPVLGLGAALSASVGSLSDAALVLGVVGANAVVGAAQAVRTDRALIDLEERGATTTDVLVDGVPRTVASDSVVVGDVLLLRSGDMVPADCRILRATGLEVDESTLTGESVPVTKQPDPTPNVAVPERASMLYEGSAVAAGEAEAVVVAVGVETEAGRSAAGAQHAPPSGVEQRLSRITNMTVPVTVGAGALATGLGFLYRRPVREAVGTGVSLMVAAVPEGLPALATLSQLASARRLASRGALVRNPRAIEALGRVDQVCFDKTGTLTEGRLRVEALSDGLDEWPAGTRSTRARRVLEVAMWATPPLDDDGSLPHATDRCVREAAAAAHLHDGGRRWARLDEVPFQSHRGMHVVLGRNGHGRLVAVKGAPEVVLPACGTWERRGTTVPMDAEEHRLVEEEIHRLARRGLRVLAVASGSPDTPGHELDADNPLPELTLHGFVAIGDPVRPSARGAVESLRSAGVHPVMVTGDHPSTAEAIAVELGILNGGRVLTGPELEVLTDDELDTVIGDVSVFARVTPLQKVRIVAAHQRGGRSVAMTGDGANDAAAIRLADAGIALGGRGTDAARSSADLVVVDDRIETIVDAVVEGRAMWESVRAAVAILVGGNLGEIGFTLAATALGGQAPLNPRQLLLVNLLTDMAPALAIALREPTDRSPEVLLHAGPDASLGGALTRDVAIRAGATMSAATSAWAVARFTGTPTRARTVGLAALVGTQLAQTVVAGGTSPTVLTASAVSAGVLVAAVQTPGISGFFGCRPLGPAGWATALGATSVATAASIAVPAGLERLGHTVAGLRVRTPDPDDTTADETHTADDPPDRSTAMNPLPIAAAGAAAVVLAVPPLRDRARDVGAAVISGTGDVAATAGAAAVVVAGKAVTSARQVASAALSRPDGNGA